MLYDLAFLLMDLTHRGLAAHANLVFNRYLDATDETDGLPALPSSWPCAPRSARHVTATQAKGAIGDAAAGLRAEAESYFALAGRLIALREKALVAIGGFSGSGKSTLAAALAPHSGQRPGARILSSDRIRKALHGVAATDPLPPEAYAPAIAERVYARMRDEAARTCPRRRGDRRRRFRPADLAAAIQQVAQDARRHSRVSGS
ncbi:MAG: AAA family ATPase [Methylobacteriaceae bacterium]|nr:AAA family ATPase [Methylobacteriaceae bacterium]